MVSIKDIKDGIKKDLNLNEDISQNDDEVMNESVFIKIPKQFNTASDIFSTKAMKFHHELYVGYVKELNKVNIEVNAVLKNKNVERDHWRALKKEEQFLNNACFLHELFFEQIGNTRNSQLNMDSLSFTEIQSNWGEFNLWQKDFIQTAIASNQGWCILGLCLYSGKLMNICLDMHDLNLVPCIPLIVADMHEHSYLFDFNSERKMYIVNFMKCLKWQVIEERFERMINARNALKKEIG